MKPTKTNMLNIHDYLDFFIMIQFEILYIPLFFFTNFCQVGGSIPLSTYQSDLLFIFSPHLYKFIIESMQATKLPSSFHTLPKGHSGPVYVARFNHSGEYCMTGAQDRGVCLYNPHKQLLIKYYKNLHNYDVSSLEVVPDNSKFITGGGDKNIILTDVMEGKTIRKYSGHSGRINSLAFNSDHSVIVSGSYDTTVNLWDNRANSPHPIQTLKGFKDSVCKVGVMGTEIVAASMDGSVRFYDIRTALYTADEFTEPIQSMSVSFSNKAYVASCTNNKLYLIEKKSGNKVQEYSGHNCEGFRVECCFNLQDSHIMTGSTDGKLYVYEIMKKEPIGAVKIGEKPISCIDAHQSGYVTGSHDGSVQFWS